MIWLRLLRPQRLRIVLVVAVLVLTTGASLSSPLILRYAIDRGLSGATARPHVLAACALVYLAVSLAGFGLQALQLRLAGRIGEGVVRDLRKDAFAHVMELDSEYFEGHASGQVIARLTSDVDALQDLVQVGGVQMVQTVLSLVTLTTLLFVLSVKLALVCVVAPAVPFAFHLVRLHRRSLAANQTIRDRVGDTVADLTEGLTGLRTVRVFGQESRMLARFRATGQALLDAYVGAMQVEGRILRAMEGFIGLAAVIALADGVARVRDGSVSAGTLSAFVLYLMMLFDPVQNVGYLLTMLQTAAAALRRLDELMRIRPAVEQGGLADVPADGSLSVRGVTFGYPGGPAVLRDVWLEVPSGETIALVGPTGAGKSTLAKLAARLHDPQAGTVSFAGVDLRRLEFAALRRRIVMSAQEGHLFSGTVLQNVQAGRYGATEADAAAALRLLVGSRLEAVFPRGVDKPVGGQGGQLSAGQRQVVSLARIALSGAAVIILDEATSHLDPGTEAVVNRAVRRLARGRTLIMIAHRLSTVRHADRVAVVADGGIVEIGRPEQLIAAGGRFAAMSAAGRLDIVG